MANYTIEYIDKHIQLISEDETVLRYFDLLFADLKVEPDSTQKCIANITIDVHPDAIKQAEDAEGVAVNGAAKQTPLWMMRVERFFASEYELKYDDFPVSSADSLCFHILDAVLYYFADNCYEGHLIHGACVSKGSNCVLLPGASGAGKTTLMTWLIKQGYAYQTDEMVYLKDDFSVESFRRSMQVKNYGFDIVAEILGDELAFEETKTNGIVKGDSFAILPWPLLNPERGQDLPNLKAIIFPNYQKDGDFSLEKISPAKTAMELMGCHINARNLTGHGVKEVSNIARNIDAYQLNYQTFDQLEQELLPLLAKIL